MTPRMDSPEPGDGTGRPLLQGGAPAATERGPERLPIWWLLVQQSWWLPQFLTFSLLLNILVPFRVADLVGDSAKAESLAELMSFQNCMALSGPAFGAASDALRCRCGRRRPFMVVGQLLTCGALGLMLTASTFFWFSLAFGLFVLANSSSNAIYFTVIPELVPEAQRGLAGGFFMLFQTLGNLLCSLFGYLVGDHYVGDYLPSCFH
eukprot:SAG31_NODE_6099_length_2171_cov_12.841216_1_plen_207_part_00